ncbi:PaaI family thioesterase [Streptomyces sp. BE230]|uniref:PaaI family thioesterase n=1 Tax=Streptomyces sp. BE230 TaxID=3002526 RepID=UPI002ED69D5D|nr:PaaI family thioesterase [Streptomyces sp. BE230]
MITWGTGDGLTRIRAIAADLAAALSTGEDFIPYSHLGLTFAEVEKGRVELMWTPSATVLNRGGIVHGGYIATALDEACGVAAISLSEPATPFVTMQLSVDYLRPLLVGSVYRVVGTVQQSGSIRTLARTEISDSAGRLCAQATGTLTPNRRILSAAAEARAGQ